MGIEDNQHTLQSQEPQYVEASIVNDNAIIQDQNLSH